MAVKNIPDDHHVVRHCRKRVVIFENGAPIGVYPAAFELRPALPPHRLRAEEYLSALYYEYFSNQPDPWKCCCGALPFQPKPNDAMAKMNVGKIKASFIKEKIAIRVTHEGGGKHHEAYAAIRPGKLNELLQAQIASDGIVEIKAVHSV